MTDIGPRELTRPLWQWKWVIASCAVLLAALALGGWQAGWWFTQQDVNRQGQVIQNGYANQAALRAEVTNGIASVEAITAQIDAASGQQRADLGAQRLSEAQDVCYQASEVNPATPLPAPQAAWVKSNCSGGTVSPRSPLYSQGG